MSVVDRLRTPRTERFVQFAGVGAVGMVVDLAVTFALLGHTHYLAANTAGFLIAVSHNFAGNWYLTYERPEGSIPRQYASYVGLHSATFAMRAVALTAAIEAVGLPATVGTAIGIAVATALNFAGTETIFGGDRTVWLDAVEATNHFAHTVWSSRIRHILVATGLYNPVFRLYTRGLSLAYRPSSRTVRAGGASATLLTEQPTETVSVLHTLEKERPVLEAFVADVDPGDRVLDVGANLGVFTALASDAGADVTAVEPHRPTAKRLRQNCPDATVHEVALGSTVQTVSLSVQHDSAGTQRPTVVYSGTSDVQQIPGDRLAAPDVIKIDVEGVELAVLWGLERTLAEQSARVVWVETHDSLTTQKVRHELEGHGYAVERRHEADQTYLRGER